MMPLTPFIYFLLTNNAHRAKMPRYSHPTLDVDIKFCDVAVIGSGFAGLSAAIEASTILPDDGRVLIVEKMAVPGGNSVMNAGQIAAVGFKAQAMAGIEDSVELMMDDMTKAGVNLNPPALIRKMIEDSNNIIEWTEQELGVEYRDRVTQLGGHSVPRTLR
jgi:succinate dehydrogenase/fumarate reductase flavoprotein subunit